MYASEFREFSCEKGQRKVHVINPSASCHDFHREYIDDLWSAISMHWTFKFVEHKNAVNFEKSTLEG